MTAPALHAPTDARLVTEALGLSWHVTHDPYAVGLDTLAGLALRDNPRRAHLVVSKVLAKHVPARAAAVRGAGLLLAGLVYERLGGERHPELDATLLTDPARSADVNRLATGSLPGSPIVLGYCETATGLGHAVADAFAGGSYLHTTRHPDPGHPALLGFEEEHSHAVAHHLQPIGTDQLEHHAPVVLVDDELTTGTTALNTIEKLRAHRAYPRFVVAALLDLRTPEARARFDERAAALGVPVDVVALLDGHLDLPPDVLKRAAPLQAALRRPAPTLQPSTGRPATLRWDEAVPLTARHRFTTADRGAFATEVARLVDALQGELPGNGSVLVLGTEECMIAAIRLAHALELAQPHREVLVQSTTRSPVLADDTDGYAIRTAIAFDCPTEPGRASFLYNLRHHAHVVVVTDAASDALGGLAAALQPASTHPVLLVTGSAR